MSTLLMTFFQGPLGPKTLCNVSSDLIIREGLC